MSHGKQLTNKATEFLTTPYARIIEPLASRCSKFRFKSLDSSSTTTRLQHIADAESVLVSPDVVQTLIASSGGDLRRAITYLQSAARLSSVSGPNKPITPHDIQEIAGVVPDRVINDFAKTLGLDLPDEDVEMDVDDGAGKLKGYDRIRDKVRALMREGYSASQLLSQVESPPCRNSGGLT